MDAQEKRTTSRCNKLHELPPVATDWQQSVWCPDCEYYDCGLCGNPVRLDSSGPCPFDGKVLPLREVAVEPPNDQPRKPLDGGECEVPLESQPLSKTLEQAIMERIVIRTGGRMRALVIELTNRELIVRGSVPCYYLKQLALQGVLDVLHGDQGVKVEFNFQIVVCPPSPRELTPLAE